MASWSEMNTGTKTAVGVAILILLGGGGYGLWYASKPPAVVTTQAGNGATALSAVVADAPPPVADVAAPVVDVAAPSAAAPAGGGVAPSMDLVRIEPDGTALVAGQAPAGALVTLLANAVEVAATKADAVGKFVAIFRLSPSASGQMLTMVVTLADGSTIAATTQVAIATITAPVVVADAGAAAQDSAAVPAADAPTPTALAVTDSGVKVLQSGSPAPAEVAANVTLDLIAYPSPDAVQFGGHGTAGQFIRLYLDNLALGDPVAIAADGTWSATLGAVAPGIHTLRVDQVDGAGKVTSRFETPFKRETPEALAAASGAAVPEMVVADADAPDATVTPLAADTTTAAPTTATAPGSTAVTTPAATTTAPPAPATVEAAAPAPALPATETSAVGKAPAATVTAGAPDADATVAGDAAPGTPVVDTTAAAVVAPATTPTVKAPATDTSVAKAGDAPGADIPLTVDGSPKPGATITITVQPGFTLWFIARQNFGKGALYVQVFNANKDKIKNPDLIYPGQVFTMPGN